MIKGLSIQSGERLEAYDISLCRIQGDLSKIERPIPFRAKAGSVAKWRKCASPVSISPDPGFSAVQPPQTD